MNDNLALSALLILGIVLHAALAGIHINEKLRGHLQKHPAIRKGMVAGGTLPHQRPAPSLRLEICSGV